VEFLKGKALTTNHLFSQTTVRTSLHISFVTMFMLSSLAAGCASLRPVVSELDSTQLTTSELTIVEGRPDTLVLNSRLPQSEKGDRLRLVRHGSGESYALVEVPLDGKLLEAAQGGGVGLTDDTMVSGAVYRYEAVLLRDDVEISRASVDVAWGYSLTRPDKLVAQQLVEGVVELEWRPAREAAIFVRNVLDENAPLRRVEVSKSAGGRWILRGLEPAGVYAVRVSLARDDGGYVRYGTPTEEMYVTLVPDTEGGDAGGR
jgi:hypothetical protein